MQTIKICGTCKHYKGNCPNNCAEDVVGSILPGDSGCYKHSEIYKTPII